ncbi:hypothetical protein OG225_14175 [Nocardia sp. NBC_01377]
MQVGDRDGVDAVQVDTVVWIDVCLNDFAEDHVHGDSGHRARSAAF